MKSNSLNHRLVLGLSILLVFVCLLGLTIVFVRLMTSTPAIPGLEGVETSTIELSPAAYDYDSLVWFDDNRLVLATSETSVVSGRLWTISIDSGQMEKIPLEAHYPECKKVGFRLPSLLPDERLGYILACTKENTVHFYFSAMDLETGQRERLISYHMPGSGPNGYKQAWNPALKVGVGNTGAPAFVKSQIYLFDKTGWEKLELGFPVAYAPAWSLDGKQIAFVAGNEEGSITGPSLPNRVYVMDSDGGNIRQVLDQAFYFVTGLVWSPDGEQLVLDAAVKRFGRIIDGLWLIDPRTGEVHLIVEGSFNSASWSLGGQQIAAIHRLDDKDSEILIVDLP